MLDNQLDITADQKNDDTQSQINQQTSHHNQVSQQQLSMNQIEEEDEAAEAG